MLDFTLVRSREKTLSDLAAGLMVSDLHALTDEMIDMELSIIQSATDSDVVFQPEDPKANDTFAATQAEINLPWTLGHVLVHTTASAEEAAMQALSLARGVPVVGRSRSEVPWETVTSMAQVRARLEESRRMRHAMLNAWPDQPDLDLTYTAAYPGATPVNAVARFIGGLLHEDSHLAQLREIMRQSQSSVQPGR